MKIPLVFASIFFEDDKLTPTLHLKIQSTRQMK